MDENSARIRIDELISLINYHNDLYHNQDAPEITDLEFDALFRELSDLENRFPGFIREDSPTKKIGGKPLEKFEPFTHPYRMLGLSNVTNEDELFRFDERIKKELVNTAYSYCVEYKLDGLAVELIYENGVLVVGSTRGDGVVGENITQNLKMVKNIPHQLKEKTAGRVIIRGEAVIHKSDFEMVNKERETAGERLFANPRNAAAGSLRQLDPKVVAGRRLRFYGYQTVIENDSLQFRSQNKLMDWIKSQGISVVDGRWHCLNIREVQKIYQDIEQKREEIPIEIDGLVVKVDEIELHDRLGEVARSPRWACAYKFKAQEAAARLNNIRLQISRHGVFTPVADIEPVRVGGVVVSRVTLHNRAEIARLDLKVGDTVIIKRAGDVIPKIIAVDKTKRIGNETGFIFPEKCPYCLHPLKSDENDTFIFCLNPDCPAKNVEKIVHFISKPCFNMEGVGEEWIKTFFESQMIQDASDLFLLTQSELMKLERMGEKLADNIVNAIQNAKKVSYVNFIVALGIKSVGVSLAALLAEHFPAFEMLTRAKKKELEAINEIGPSTASAIAEYFSDFKNIHFLEKLFANGVKIVYEKKKLDSEKLKNKTFLFTGKLSAMSRDEAKRLAVKNGGKVLSSVSKNLDYLVVGEDPGSKLEKAGSLGVKVLSEEDFLKMIAG